MTLVLVSQCFDLHLKYIALQRSTIIIEGSEWWSRLFNAHWLADCDYQIKNGWNLGLFEEKLALQHYRNSSRRFCCAQQQFLIVLWDSWNSRHFADYFTNLLSTCRVIYNNKSGERKIVGFFWSISLFFISFGSYLGNVEFDWLIYNHLKADIPE